MVAGLSRMLIVKASINIRNSTKKSSDWLSVDATFSSMTDFHMEYRIWIESVFQGQGVENKKSSTYCRKSVRYEWKTKKKQNVYLLWDPLYMTCARDTLPGTGSRVY